MVTNVEVDRLGVDLEKRRLTVQVSDMDAARRAIPPVIVQLPVIFERCSPAVSSLEDIFLRVTGGLRMTKRQLPKPPEEPADERNDLFRRTRADRQTRYRCALRVRADLP
jgi:hypothetical protein